MDTNDPLPFVVHIDDSDEPGDVLDSLALGPFIAGHHPISQTRHLSRVRPDATLVPAGSTSYRVAEGYWRTVVLSQGSGWTLKAVRFRDNTAVLNVTATDKSLAEAILAEVSAEAIEPPPPVGLSIRVGFWHLGARGPQRSARPIEVTPWASVRRNYTATAAAILDDLMSLAPAKLTGRLLLLHGPPGTGKTSVVRAIAHEWRDWCATDCVLDPEHLLRNPGYLLSVLLGNDDDDDQEKSDRWRMLVLEDCDEIVAEPGSGQALSRLLNLTDGLLGQGRNILICITTNADVSRFHPAAVRPGRCLRQIEIGLLSPQEAAAWLGVDPAESSSWSKATTLADLYAAQGGYRRAPAEPDPPIGQYL